MNYNKFMPGRRGKAGGPLTATETDKRLGFPAFEAMLKLRPDFFVGTGDIVCHDNLKTICGDRHWQYHSVHPSGSEEFGGGALNDENARLGIAPGAKNGSDSQGRIKQHYTSPTPNGGFLQITADDRLTMEHFDSRGKRLYRAVK